MKQKTNNLLFEDFQTPAMAIDDVDTGYILGSVH